MAGSSETTLNILLINQNWFQQELIAAGHSVLFVGWPAHNPDIELPTTGTTLDYILDRLPPNFSPDRIVYYDNSGPVSVVGIEHAKVPTLFYSVDSHHHVEWHKYFAATFDRTLVAQRDYVPHFIDVGAYASWFPLWAPVHVEPCAEKSVDVSFRGNLNAKLHPQRALFFETLQNYVTVDAKMGPYNQVFPRSKIVINQTVKNDINFRVYEALMCGPLLLTPDIGNGLEELFVPGEELICYQHNNAEDAAEKIRYYLAHENERAQIAARGREALLTRHTAEVRARQLIDILLPLQVSSRANRYFGAGVAYLTSATLCKQGLPEVANYLVRYSAECFCAAPIRGEECQPELSNSIFVCKFLLEHEGYIQKSLELFQEFQNNYPADYLIKIGYLDCLKKAQQDEAARAFAATFSPIPEELLTSAPEMMEKLRQDLFIQLGSSW